MNTVNALPPNNKDVHLGDLASTLASGWLTVTSATGGFLPQHVGQYLRLGLRALFFFRLRPVFFFVDLAPVFPEISGLGKPSWAGV